MAAKTLTIPFVRLCSYNMHGFANGASMLKDLCMNHDIILLQEHWLLKDNLYKIDNVDNNFPSYSLSSMNAKAAAGILTGRPFGGVAILWRKTISCFVKILEIDQDNGKFISIRLHRPALSDLIITCVYFPCLSTPRDYIISTSSIIAHIDNVLSNNADALHIIAEDYNFECFDGNNGIMNYLEMLCWIMT